MQIFQLDVAVKLINSQLMTTFLAPFCFHVAKTANISQIKYTKCSKCPPSAFTQARRHFPKFAIDLQIASCGNSTQIFTSADFSSGMFFGCEFTKQNDVIVTSLLRWYSVSWYSVVLVFANRILTDKNTQRRVDSEITCFETKLVPFLHAIMKLYKIYAVRVKLRPH